MHHWVRQQGCVFDYRPKHDNLRFSVMPLNVTFVNMFNFCHFLFEAWSNPDFTSADEEGPSGFEKDFDVSNNENTMKAAY